MNDVKINTASHKLGVKKDLVSKSCPPIKGPSIRANKSKDLSIHNAQAGITEKFSGVHQSRVIAWLAQVELK